MTMGATARKLERASADPLGRGAVKPAPPISLKSGTRLVREWRGVTHSLHQNPAETLHIRQLENGLERPAAVRAPHPDIWRLWLPPMPPPGS